MAYSSSSAAYDLSAYELPKEKAKPTLKVVGQRNNRTGSSMINLRICTSFVIVVTLVSLMVYNQVQLNEISGDINRLNKQITELESDNDKMMSELEATMSLRAIGDKAKNELGMNRLDKYQTVYICLEQEDKIERTENSPGASLGEKLKLTIQGAIASFQEYLGQE